MKQLNSINWSAVGSMASDQKWYSFFTMQCHDIVLIDA